MRGLLSFFLLSGIPLLAQSVLGVIDGKVVDEVDGRPLSGCRVSAEDHETGARFAATTSSNGAFSLPLLPPGTYDVSVSLPVNRGPAYRPALVKGLEVAVAGFVYQEFRLSLLTDIWQQGLKRTSVAQDRKTVLQFYGPDVDTGHTQIIDEAPAVRGNLEPSITDVVDSEFIERLPLAGRDVYELIALQPGTSNDQATARSAGISVNGQRPSASNFLLDGRENNNYLITGPFAPLPPEAVAEYRISTNNFAAEYGRTSGYLANAVTRQGAAGWHGMAYAYAEDHNWNARENFDSSGLQAGFRLAGALARHLFTSTVIGISRNRALASPTLYVLPTWSYIDSLSRSSAAWRVLDTFRPPTAGGAGQVQDIEERPSATDWHVTGLERVDWVPRESRHVSASATIFHESQPDFFWSPYPAFRSGLHQNAAAASGTWNERLRKVNAEFRAALTRDSLGWDRAHPEIPRLTVASSDVTLPGSPASYLLENAGTAIEASANFLVSTPRHLVKWGGGFLRRVMGGVISTPDGNLEYRFQTLHDFASDMPSQVQFADARHAAVSGAYLDPDMDRRYRYAQTFLFVQDSFHVTSRFLLHYGARYDFLGSPANVGGQKDALIGLGSGSTLAESLAMAKFLPLPSGSQTLYHADTNDAAARVGFALNLRGSGDSILRGSYGLYYDRPFDNLWLNLRFNDAVPASTQLGTPNLDYLNTPFQSLLSGRTILPQFQRYPLTLYQPGFHTPYVHSFFLGIQHRLSYSVLLESDYAGSLGRKLLTTDTVNRSASVPGCVQESGNTCRPAPNLDVDIDYRGNQGTSEYHALVTSLRIRQRRGETRISYTYSHAIDNQSDPLTGTLSQNLQVTRPTAVPFNYRPAGFTVQYGSSSDRASADFDQRHNVVFYSFLNLPSPGGGWWRPVLANWSLAEVGAWRSGHPYTIYGDSFEPFLYNRADLVNPAILTTNIGAAYGGRLLNPAAFASAKTDQLGTVGRNAFTGPAFYSLDLSLSRTIHLSRSHETRILSIRLDAYNSLNHINSGNPLPEDLFLNSNNFAVPAHGLTSSPGGLLAAMPLSESPRRVQLMLRLLF